METNHDLEDRETQKAALANRHWLEALGKMANNVDWLDVLVKLADNISWLEVLIDLANKTRLSIDSVNHKDYHYSVSEYPPAYRSVSN